MAAKNIKFGMGGVFMPPVELNAQAVQRYEKSGIGIVATDCLRRPPAVLALINVNMQANPLLGGPINSPMASSKFSAQVALPASPIFFRPRRNEPR